MDFDPLYYPHPSRRMMTYGANGMVATSQHLAAQAGLQILQEGGNAIDAAIATAACLAVVEPTSNGIGSDAFAIIWNRGRLYGLNGSGAAPMGISVESLKELGYETMPRMGLLPVTVPGAPGLWAELSEKMGSRSLEEVLQPAIKYAEEGYPVSPVLGQAWARAFSLYSTHREQCPGWLETFTKEGKAPGAGALWRCPDQGRTLRLIGKTGARSFYQGELAEKIDAFSKEHGGFLRMEDLASYSPEWVEPIAGKYRDYEVWEIPPNGQGLVALLALQIMDGFVPGGLEDVDTCHRAIEAMKLAFADGKNYITDPRAMEVSVDALLSPEYATQRRDLIGQEARIPPAGKPPEGGTVYLATADGQGNMVSFIQSNYMGFGSGTVVPGTGIALQNRGHTFSLNPQDANVLKPGKKTYHTIIPGFLTKDQKPIGPFGVMGGFMQPQGHLQVMMHTIDYHLNPQAALDAPRWQWLQGNKVAVESHFPQHLAKALSRRGHEIEIPLGSGSFGRGQIIWRDPEQGVLCGGTESRTDGAVVSW